MISRLFKIPYRVIELDTITLKIYYKEGVLSRCYAVIENSTKDFYLRFAGNTKPFWLLLSAAVEEDYKAMKGYCIYLLFCAIGLADDEKITKGIIKIHNKWHKDIEKQAIKKAKSVTAEEEATNQSIMQAISTPIDSKDFKEEVKKVLKEIND